MSHYSEWEFIHSTVSPHIMSDCCWRRCPGVQLRVVWSVLAALESTLCLQKCFTVSAFFFFFSSFFFFYFRAVLKKHCCALKNMFCLSHLSKKQNNNFLLFTQGVTHKCWLRPLHCLIYWLSSCCSNKFCCILDTCGWNLVSFTPVWWTLLTILLLSGSVRLCVRLSSVSRLFLPLSLSLPCILSWSSPLVCSCFFVYDPPHRSPQRGCG